MAPQTNQVAIDAYGATRFTKMLPAKGNEPRKAEIKITPESIIGTIYFAVTADESDWDGKCSLLLRLLFR